MARRGARAAVIFAAGLGTRMRSGRAKVLHRVGGLPLVTWSVRAVCPLVDRVVVVVGHEREAVTSALAHEGVRFAVQDQQLGTGHALRCAHEQGELDGFETLVVLAGDVPRLTTASLRGMLDEHERRDAAATLLTFQPEDPTGYGRIVRENDDVRAIVEDKHCTEAQRAIGECNAALYAFAADDVLPRLPKLPLHGAETYLTDVVEHLLADERRVASMLVPEDEVAGINTQAQLAEAEARYRRERIAALHAAGVSIPEPGNVVVEADCEVGAGTELGDFVSLEGRTRVGTRCVIGPMVRLRDASVGDGAVVRGPLALVSTDVPAGAIVGE